MKYVWSAARVQEEFDWTRSSLRKCIRPLVENGLRAHDDDPRVPVLVNRDGHQRPMFQRRFSGTPFDCFFVLSVLLQTSGKRTSKSLRLAGNRKNRHRVIVLSTRQHRPTDPSQLLIIWLFQQAPIGSVEVCHDPRSQRLSASFSPTLPRRNAASSIWQLVVGRMGSLVRDAGMEKPMSW